MHPASLQAQDLAGVWYIFGGAALFVAVFVYGLILYSIVRWREKATDTGLPPQFTKHPPIEITGVVIPLIIVIGLFYITYIREGVVDFLKPNPYLTVDVTAYQWSWQFRYPGRNAIVANGTVHEPPTLVLPVGKMTQINLYSADVVHSFWIPSFLFKRDANAGITNHFDITPTKTGFFHGVCAEYCGLDHALMTFTVQVVPVADFDRWVASGGRASL
ncbi:MAG TPA: cytochrome c oxidase subunit II [Candidatus Baltobacteraceae bacterium]|nr:cytochrome c oxidase subunit II [Candidatus Baltobacteraceae bacterium]